MTSKLNSSLQPVQPDVQHTCNLFGFVLCWFKGLLSSQVLVSTNCWNKHEYCWTTELSLEVKLHTHSIYTSVYVLSVQVRFSAFKVVNVLAVCSMPFAVHLIDFTKNNRPIARYYMSEMSSIWQQLMGLIVPPHVADIALGMLAQNQYFMVLIWFS